MKNSPGQENDTPFDSGENYADIGGIFAESTYATPIAPPLREFKPWHKPRKQYVRAEQWSAEIRELLEARSNGDRSISYLGLPGADFLDIRHIYHQFRETDDFKLRFLGFDKSAESSSPDRDAHNISLQEIMGFRGVDRSSVVLPDDIRKIAQENSHALSYVKRLGPFDVINIDLCGHFGKDHTTIDLSIYNAICNILGVQYRNNRPWSLLLTTRLDRDGMATDTRSKLVDRVLHLASVCGDFSKGYAGILGDLEITELLLDELSEESFFRAMAVAYGAWFLGLARQIRCKISIRSAGAYQIRRHAESFDMLSLVVRFDPVNSIGFDPARLASVENSLPSQCAEAERLIEPIARLTDIDARLERDPDLYETMKNESLLLLQQARYETSGYDAWLLTA